MASIRFSMIIIDFLFHWTPCILLHLDLTGTLPGRNQSETLFQVLAFIMRCCCAILLLTLINESGLQLTDGKSSSRDTHPDLGLPEGNDFRVNFNNETKLRGVRLPCQCDAGECGCCSGNVLQNFNINIRQHFCINMTYEREDASLGVKMSFNDIVLVSSRVSVETEWNNRTVFSYSFDCMRLGVNGVAIIPPEAGGGLPHPPEQEIDQIEEYDELLENQTTKKPTKKRTTKITMINATTVRTTRKP